MSAKGNPKFSCPSILSHSNSKSFGACSKTDSREKLFDSSLKTVNVSVNTEIPMDLSYGPRKRVRDYFHFYEQMDYCKCLNSGLQTTNYLFSANSLIPVFSSSYAGCFCLVCWFSCSFVSEACACFGEWL